MSESISDEIKMLRRLQIDRMFLDVAKTISSMSYCVKAKVGAVIVSSNSNILAYGYNGTPSGMDNQAETVEDGVLVTKRETLHAESNAIAKVAKSTSSSDGATLYVTMSPCFDCAKMIIQSGILRVVYKEEYRDLSGIDLLKSCNIVVDQIKE